jgi:hypothetical protein
MIISNPKRKYTILSVMTLAVLIICLGSLINFHQYKIWGKPLIPEFVGYKPDQGKSKESQKVQASPSSPEKSFNLALVAIPGKPAIVIAPIRTCEEQPGFTPPVFILAGPSLLPAGLRAPPLA